jgi:hypothetical protein
MIFFQNLTELHPFFSLLFSLFLFVGLYQIGELLFFNKQIKLIFFSISELKYQKILLAVNFLMFVLFPVVLFLPNSRIVLNIFSIFIFSLGIYKIFVKLKNANILDLRNAKLNIEIILYFLIILGFFLITFSPVNHADSLDYHLSGAMHINKTGRLPFYLENPHNLLVGAGEVFYSLGFFFGAEQFGTLIQFSGLLSLIGIVKKINQKYKYFFILLIISSPVLIFLISSPKPQLFHICSNAIIFILIFVNYKSIEKFKINQLYLVILANVFLLNSINAKYSFILSGFIIFFLLTIFSIRLKFFFQTILVIFLFLTFFYFDFIYWKYITWGGNFFKYIIDPLPTHLEGIKFFKNYLINYKRDDYLIYLFVPRTIAQYTDALGIGFLVLFLFFKHKEFFFYYLFISIFYLSVNFIFGQPSSRFFFEIYLWMILLLSINKKIYIPRIFKILLYPQFIIAVIVVWYAVMTMSYGFINSSLRDKVMSNTANGYSLFKWSNSIIDKKDRILSMHRSISLSKVDVISTGFLFYVNSQGEHLKSYHIKELLSDSFSGSTYLLVFGKKEDVGIFSNCLDFLYKEIKDVGRHVGRNPFNKSSSYDGFLFKLKDIKKTKCLNYL